MDNLTRLFAMWPLAAFLLDMIVGKRVVIYLIKKHYVLNQLHCIYIHVCLFIRLFNIIFVASRCNLNMSFADKLSGVMDARKADKMSDRLMELNEQTRGPAKSSSRKRALEQKEEREPKRSKAKEPMVGVQAENLNFHQAINTSVPK